MSDPQGPPLPEPPELAQNEDDVLVESNSSSKFDLIIGEIENIIMKEEFRTTQTRFLDNYCKEFTSGDNSSTTTTSPGEFSHSQFLIFQEYSRTLGGLIEGSLVKRFNELGLEFDIEEDLFRELTGPSSAKLDGEIFEILFTLIDFVKFHELFVDHRLFVEGKTPLLMDNSIGTSGPILSVRPANISDEEN